MKILVVDIGNTSTSLGLYAKGKVTRLRHFDERPMKPARIRAEVDRVVGRAKLSGAALGSVVPGVNRSWISAVRSRCGVGTMIVNDQLELGIPVTYPKPETIGADRLANACAVHDRYRAPAIVVDFGTAVTFDIVTREEGYIGGVIAPGPPLMFNYLSEKTALLPDIHPGRVKRSIGKSTEEAMIIGALHGYQGVVREILSGIRKEIGKRRVRVIATGGYAKWVLADFKPAVRIDPDLTLYGLGKIYELNTPFEE